MAFFTRAVTAASSKNELPPPEVAQPARPSSAPATTNAKRCLSLLIFISLVRVPRDRNTAPKHVQPRKNRTLRAFKLWFVYRGKQERRRNPRMALLRRCLASLRAGPWSFRNGDNWEQRRIRRPWRR